MAKDSKAKTNGSAAVSTKQPRSLKVAEKGVKTGHDFANLMSALMSDLIDGRVTPAVGNAACNAGGKLLKVVEMQYKYGTVGDGVGPRTLNLALDNSESVPQLAQSM